MTLLEKKLINSKNSIERPIFHPEKTLNKHILLVCARALLIDPNNPDLILSALLHDICKPDSGFFKESEKGQFWSNPDHPKQIFELIQNNDDIRHFIWSFGGEIENVANICNWHMAIKEGIPKKAKHIPHIDKFAICDDMINRKQIPEVEGRFPMPDGSFRSGKLWFCGQSPLDQVNDNNRFTITINRTAWRFKITDIPNMFKGRWSDLKPFLDLLV
jgi:hypothetical protein